MENKEIAKEWKYKGRQCVILYFNGHYCAYVETKLKGVGYSQEFGTYETSPSYNIEGHGGVTFSGELKDVSNKFKGVWFFGIDFAHAGDYVEDKKLVGFQYQDRFQHEPDEHKWQQYEVEDETIKLADSIIAYEKVYEKYKKAFEKFKKEIKSSAESSTK